MLGLVQASREMGAVSISHSHALSITASLAGHTELAPLLLLQSSPSWGGTCASCPQASSVPRAGPALRVHWELAVRRTPRFGQVSFKSISLKSLSG